MKTVLITGCSSGFGLETAKYFLARGWRVIATMRDPAKSPLPGSANLQVLSLDVTNQESIAKAVRAAGPIDALVNNAGAGMLNALEGVSLAQIRALFETNTFGAMAMIQAVLPQFRERKAGVIVNVSSSVTLKSYPLLSVYSGTKAAMNAFTESLALELAPFGIRARLVLPGRSLETPFAEKVAATKPEFPAPYAEMVQQVFAGWAGSTDPTTSAADVAEAVWRAVNDTAAPMRIPAGADAVALYRGE